MKADNPRRKVALLLTQGHSQRAKQHIVRSAKQLNWRLYDLSRCGDALLDDPSLDGFLTDELWESRIIQRLQGRPLPKVRLGRFEHPKDGLYPSVVPDLTSAARLIAEYLHERRFQHAGFIAYDIANFHWKHLYDPLTVYAQELGIKCHLLDFEPLPSLAPEERYAVRDNQLTVWLRNVPKPIAIVGFNESVAADICRRCLDAGLRVPDQVAVLSCGDDPLVCECTPVQLTSVPTTGPEVANAAIDLLHNLIDGLPPPKSTVFVAPLRITTRESTDMLATTSPLVDDAVRFMWGNLRRQISVDDVANAVDISRRKLERAFRQRIGRGVNAELLRRRLEYCCELLVTEDLSVVDIVPMIGFSSTAYLHKAFRKRYGMTPQQWRRIHKLGKEPF